MYATPRTISDALTEIAANDAVIVAGGTDHFPMAGERPQDKHLVDITQIDGFGEIAETASGWRFGAGVTWAQIAAADLPPAFRGLQEAAREVGSVQIQNRATIGGNLCNASPAADGAPPLLALGAEVELSSPAGARLLPLNGFILGVRQTALAAGEIVSAVIIPTPAAGAAGAFVKLGARRYLVISIAMVAATVWKDAEGRIAGARVAVGACSPVTERLTGLEARVIGLDAASLADPGLVRGDDLAGLSPISDPRGDAAYRLDAVAELCRRALAAAFERAA